MDLTISMVVRGGRNDDRMVVSPVTHWVHTDHLERPVMMTDSGGSVVWRAAYLPFGEVASLTGPATLNYRFPGQWFQLESGLHYNWHRHYDPSTGRYLQPDPLGMPDGPSRWAYVRNSPLMEVDPEGKVIPVLIGIGAGYVVDYALGKYKERYCKCVDTLLGLFGNAAVGGIIGGSGPFEKKPRSGIAGGGRSGARTSTFSLWNHSASYSPKVRNIFTRVLRKLPYAGGGVFLYEFYEAYNCV